MELTKNSVLIPNSDLYRFRLELDDISGIIRLTKNKAKADNTRITDRNVPITEEAKWKFYRMRTGYSDNPYTEYGFIGSYIDKKKDPINYNKWKVYIVGRYRKLRDTYRLKEGESKNV